MPDETALVLQFASSKVWPKKPSPPTTDCHPPPPPMPPLLDEPPLLDLPPLELLELPVPTVPLLLPPPPPLLELLELLLLASSDASWSAPPPELLELELELELEAVVVAGAEASPPPGLLGALLEQATVATTETRAPKGPRTDRTCCVRMRQPYGGDPYRATPRIGILSFPIRMR